MHNVLLILCMFKWCTCLVAEGCNYSYLVNYYACLTKWMLSCTIYWQLVRLVPSDSLMEVACWKEMLKSATTMCGVQCVVMDGITLLLKLSAESLVFPLLEHLLYHLVKFLLVLVVWSGWLTLLAKELKLPLTNVIHSNLVSTKVIVPTHKTLEWSAKVSWKYHS